MNRRRSIPFTLTALVALLTILAACGGATSDATSDATSNPLASDAPMSEPPAATPSSAEEPPAPEPPTDGTDIDWATVDLTTIDWTTIDLRTIDWVAIEDNPTAENLGEEVGPIIQSRLNPGSATLVIGEERFEFASFDCASGHDNTESTTFSFTTNSFEEFDGVRTQMQFTIEDPSGTGQTDGDGVRHRIDLDDIDDFENPSISWYMSEADSVSLDGYELSVSGTFDDQTTDGVIEGIGGSLEAECSDMSRF
jgi:hypothetical protein